MRAIWRMLNRGLFLLAVILGGTLAAVGLLLAFPVLVDILNAGPFAVFFCTLIALALALAAGFLNLLLYGHLPRRPH